MIASRATPSIALETWARLLPDAATPWVPNRQDAESQRSDLAQNGLRLLGGDGAHVRRLRSWSLPARHPKFAFPPPRRLPAVRTMVDLWPGGEWSQAAFDALLRVKATHSWWLLEGAARAEVLAARVRMAFPAIRHARALVEARCPGARVRAVVLTGSYLWAATPRPSVDVAVIADLGYRATALDHKPDLILPRAERWTIGDQTVSRLDLLVVSTAALCCPTQAATTLGDWRLPDGREFWYDTRASTVLSAIRQTFRACLTVEGGDFFPAETEDPEAMLALAYYFTQEASQLLDWRYGLAKASNRLWEANLILDRVTMSTGDPSAPGARSDYLTDRARQVAATLSGNPDVDAATLALLQGWFRARPTALLPWTIQRLVRIRAAHRGPVCSCGTVATMRELLARARAEQWPTLSRLAGNPRDVPAAQVAALLGDPWAASLLARAR